MKKCKKLLSVVVILCMLVQFLGCKPNTNACDFDNFIDNVHLELFNPFDKIIQKSYMDKSSVGFYDGYLKYNFTSEKFFKETMDKYKNLLNKLNNYNYYQLSDEQKLNYDILKDYLKRELVFEDDYQYYYSYNTTLASEVFLLQANTWYLEFKQKEDYDSYLQIIKDTINCYKELPELCKFQMENKFISREKVENLIKYFDYELVYIDIENILAGSTLYTEDEKKQYLEEYNKLYKEYDELSDSTKEQVQKLYDTYKDKVDGESKVSPLSQSNEGRKYYKHLLQNLLGTQVLSVEQLVAELKLNAAKTKMKLDKLCKETGMEPSYNSYDDNIKFCNFDNNQRILDYLENNYSKHFPEIPKLNYVVELGNLPQGARGVFYGSYIDAPFDDLTVGVWEKYSELNYSTLAHEAFPGHMYQFTYQYTNDIPTFRKIVTQKTYTEGWADYIQKYILNYLPIEDNTTAKIRTLSTEYERYNRCLLDIYVNYYGWTYEEFDKYYMEVTPREDGIFKTSELYQQIIDSPCYYTINYPIYGGYFEELYNYAKLVLGDKFTPVEFHKVILDCGPTNITIIREQVNKYIINKKLSK